jgi:predicted TIM-barrel fold metal-dependent hydrolase
VLVDAHAHVWVLDAVNYPWQPTFGFVPTANALPDDLLRAMDRHGVGHALLVQPSAYGPDHRFLLDTVATWPDRFLPIGLVDPADPASIAAAPGLVRDAGCVGLRVNLSLDLAYAERQAARDGWDRLASLDVPVTVRATPAHHQVVLGILERYPGLTLVVDHLGLPDLGTFARAEDRLADLARFDQCRLKIAGLGLISRVGPPYRDVWSLVEAALRRFGASRLVWGSDYPTGGSDGYEGAVAAMEAMPFLSDGDRERVMTGTALELWGEPRTAARPRP